MADSSVTFSGLSSGIDTASLIKALVDAKRQPITTLQNQANDYQSRLTKINDFAGKVTALRTAVTALTTSTSFASYSAATSNAEVITASASSTASEGSHTVAVTQLAQGQTTRSNATSATTNTALGLTGTLLLTPTGNPTAADTVTVEATDTLEAIRNKINSSGTATGKITLSAAPAEGTTVTVDGITYEFTTGTPTGTNIAVNPGATAAEAATNLQAASVGRGANSTMSVNGAVVTVTAGVAGAPGNLVQMAEGSDSGNAVALSGQKLTGGGSPSYSASIMNTGTSASPAYSLILTARGTGEANGFTVTPGGGLGWTFSDTQAARDAILSVDGINDIHRGTNVVNDVITGVTFSLVKDTAVSGPISVTVSKDSGSIAAKIQSFLTAYNDLRTYINTNTKYDTNSKTNGPLVGESSVSSVSRSLQSILGNPVAGLTGVYNALSRVGITTQKDGTLSMNSSKMDAAMEADFQGVVNLFVRNLSTGVNGIAYQIQAKIDQWMAPGSGLISGRETGIQDVITHINAQINQKESQIAVYEQSLKEKYARMEQLIATLKDQSSALSSISGRY